MIRVSEKIYQLAINKGCVSIVWHDGFDLHNNNFIDPVFEITEISCVKIGHRLLSLFYPSPPTK
jgi:hypothetical protein